MKDGKLFATFMDPEMVSDRVERKGLWKYLRINIWCGKAITGNDQLFLKGCECFCMLEW